MKAEGSVSVPARFGVGDFVDVPAADHKLHIFNMGFSCPHPSFGPTLNTQGTRRGTGNTEICPGQTGDTEDNPRGESIL